MHQEKKVWYTFLRFPKNVLIKVEDVLNLGDKVKVVCMGKDKMGRFSFSMKDVVED